MAKGIGTVQVKRQRGKLTVITMGKTPRDQSFIKDMKPLAASKVDDPDFKKEMAAAIEELFA